MHKLIKNEIAEHFLLTLWPTHKMELAIENAFELSPLNNDYNTDFVNIFYQHILSFQNSKPKMETL